MTAFLALYIVGFVYLRAATGSWVFLWPLYAYANLLDLVEKEVEEKKCRQKTLQ